MTSLFASAYVHRLDPFVFSEALVVRWYGLAYVAGFVIAWLFVRWMAKSNRSPLTVTHATDYMFFIMVGVLIGGRLGYAAFYDQSLWFGFSSSFPFWDLLAINRGGMASHGGIIGFIVASIVFARKNGLPALHLIDMGAFISGVGLSLGRVANFVNGELWGRVLPSDQQASAPSWSVKYPEEISLASYPLERLQSVREATRGLVDGGEIDAITRAMRLGNAAVIDAVRPYLTAFYPSQLLQALAEGPLLVGALALIWIGPRKPGVVGSWFLIIYGVLRILTEQVREPDDGVALIFGLTRGQLLSVLMVVAGFIALPLCMRRDTPKYGGLLRKVESV